MTLKANYKKMKQEKQRNEDGEGGNLFKEKRKRTKRKIREKGNNIKKKEKKTKGVLVGRIKMMKIER